MEPNPFFQVLGQPVQRGFLRGDDPDGAALRHGGGVPARLRIRRPPGH